MTKPKPFRCVHCGKPAAALFKSYGPSVLKLTKCEACSGTVDKYVEYDPVIVMIDLVLMSREAQRHVLYNTDFKPYWKLFITLMMLETYGVWRTDSLINITIDAICQNTTSGNYSLLSIPVEVKLHMLTSWLSGCWAWGQPTSWLSGCWAWGQPTSWLSGCWAWGQPTSWLSGCWAWGQPTSWLSGCWAWGQPERGDDNDLFIWEKDFYIQFIATFCGIAVFLTTTYCLMYVVQYFSSHNQVPVLILVKAFSLANMSILFTIPMLVWGNSETPHETRTFHYVLVFAYSFVLFYNVYTVVYERHMMVTVLILIISHCAKFHTTFSITPHVRGFIT